MMEECCYFNKDSLIIKPPKKYPLVLWMAALALVMMSGVYICILYLKQGIPTTPNPIMVRLKELKPSPDPGILQSEVPYVDHPEPTTYSRNECACTPVRFFAILSMQRSGSGCFETLLNSHVNVSSNSEIFSVKERWSNISSILQTLDKVYNMDWYGSASKNECTAAVGFKWMLNQGVIQHHDETVKYFNQRGVSVILLFRRNLLRRMVSVLANMHDWGANQLNGTHKAHVHSRDEADVLSRYKPTINVTSLVPELEQMDKWGADALDYFKSTRHILLYYEDLVNNHKKVKNVLKFLRLPKRKEAFQPSCKDPHKTIV